MILLDASIIFSIILVNAVGPVLGYISQLNLIKKEKSLGIFRILS